MRTGCSLYLGSGEEENAHVIERARAAGMDCAFTSFQIPEEGELGLQGLRERASWLLRACREAGIGLIVDVSPSTLDMLGLSSIEELEGLGVACIRLDCGFSDARVVELSRRFRIAFNASTTSLSQVRAWEREGADLSRFCACHNYYPKPLTGLSTSYVREVNDSFRLLGVETAAFIPGDGRAPAPGNGLRGPLYEGLPTVEEHRNRRTQVTRNALSLFQEAHADCVFVGDPDLSDAGWDSLAELAKGYTTVCVELAEGFEFLDGVVQRDRSDSSPYVLRSATSRLDKELSEHLRDAVSALPSDYFGRERTVGSVCVSSGEYGRYAGELEIMRQDVPGDHRVAVIGRVCPEHRTLIPFLTSGMGAKFSLTR